MKIIDVKKILVAILMIISIVSCSKKNDGFIIKGTVSGHLKLDSIAITPESMEIIKPIYKVPVVDGKFTITGKVKAIEKVNIGNEKANVGNYFILENDEYTIDIKKDFFIIKGGKINEEVFGFYNTREYNETMKKYTELTEELLAQYKEDKNAKDVLDQLNQKLDIHMKKAYEIEDAHFEKIMNDKNASTLSKMFVVTNSQDYESLPAKKRRALLTKYKEELGEHRNLDIFVEYLDQQDLKSEMSKSVAAGSQFKPVTGSEVDGTQVDLSDVVKKNKYTLLEFWASWCSPCRAEVPHLKKAYAKYKSKGLAIYSYSIDDNANHWKKAMKEDQPNWDIHVLKNGKDGEKVLNSYGISGIPASFLIDQSGTIVASNEELRGENLEKLLSELSK